jgi:hypothetical protein
MSGQIVIPEVLQQDHFLGQGGAVRGGGDKTKLLEALFLRAFFFFRFGGSLRGRQFEADGGYFGDIGEIFGQGGSFCRFTGLFLRRGGWFGGRLVFSSRLGRSRRCRVLWCRRGCGLGLVLGIPDDVEIMLVIPLT